jgi:DNA polymerase-3 subunit alpha
MEKELLGLYISDHPLLKFKEKFDTLVNTSSDQLREKQEKEDVVVGGMITRVRVITTKKNDQMAFVAVEDFKGTVDVTVFPSVYQECRKSLIADSIVIVRGKVNRRERVKGDGDQSEEIGIICDALTLLADAQSGNGKSNGNGNGNGVTCKTVNVRLADVNRDRLMALRDLLGVSTGDSPVLLHIPRNGTTTRISVSLKVDPSPRLLSQIEGLLGKEVVWLDAR